MSVPKRQLTFNRDDLPGQYQQLVLQNPDVIGGIERAMKNCQWTDEEIRTAQLLVACSSNASLKRQLEEMETRIAMFEESMSVQQ